MSKFVGSADEVASLVAALRHTTNNAFRPVRPGGHQAGKEIPSRPNEPAGEELQAALVILGHYLVTTDK